MKNKFLKEKLTIKPSLAAIIRIVSLTITLTLLGPSVVAHANPELDRQYALESVGFLKSWDNVDGLFSDYVANAYKDYFAKHTRFRLQDLSRAEAALTNSKISYQKLIDDPEVLGELSRSLKVQSLLRTKILKEGYEYRFTIDWLHSPKMEQLTTETFTLQQPSDGKAIGLGDIKGSLEKALDEMIQRLPFQGLVTGRDNNSVTINLGSSSNLKKGDTLMVATLDEVKKHPLLKTIVDWRMTPTGKIQVDEVDEGIAFCKVIEEIPGRQIARYQKITQIIPKPVPEAPPIIDEKQEKVNLLQEAPTLGWAAAELWIGGFSRQYSSPDTNFTNGVTNTAGSLFYGIKASGQLWLTREWFSELELGFGSAGYSSQTNSRTTIATAVDGGLSVLTAKLDIGYTYFTTGDIFGPKGWVKLGYHTISYSLPTFQTAQLVPSTFKGWFLGVGGDLPIRDNFGALLSLDFGFLTSGKEGFPISGPPASANDVGFFIGGYYHFAPRLTGRVGLDVQANGADFIGGTSFSHKIVSFGPTLVYYF